MSSTQPKPQQAQSLQHPDVGAAGFPHGRDHNHAADSAHALTAGPATDAVHLFHLRNSRSALTNSALDPPPYPSVSSTTKHSPLNNHNTNSHSDTSRPLTPVVNLPPFGYSATDPQRVDSGYDDEYLPKPSSLGPGIPLQSSPDQHHGRFSTLSPIVDSPPAISSTDGSLDSLRPTRLPLSRKSSAPSLKPISRTPSLKAALGRGIGSAASSRVPSPIITAMGDVTPLPSPLLSGDSPGPWKRLGGRPPSRDMPHPLPTIMSESVLVTSNGESISAALANQSKRKGLSGTNGAAGEDSSSSSNSDKDASKNKIHTRNRSISDYHPDHVNIPKRMVSVSATSRPNNPNGNSMRREPHLSEARGLTPVEKPPSPPPSESSVTASESASSTTTSKPSPNYEYFDARGRRDGKLRRWRAVKFLGQGTFSRVVLATSHVHASEDEMEAESNLMHSGLLTPEPTSSLERKALVAVKICEHGPKGGASEDRVEMSLKRELEIMQTIHHPSLVDLKAWSIEPTRAILVLDYCPGGDLFDVATSHRALLVPSLLRRIFAELVGAVQYLHERHIVHRDIKLENVLVNLTPQELSDSTVDWQTYPYSVTTVTDLGLSRRVADDEILQTRCGSEDYAAPEVIMGLGYNGRATDAWSLGVLLYALLESRLPFDPPPGMSDALRMRSRTSHRVARMEWQWIKYAGEDGDHEGDAKKFEEVGMLGAMDITEGLLKRARSRWPLDKVANTEWVKGGINVEGGIRFREAEDGEEVL